MPQPLLTYLEPEDQLELQRLTAALTPWEPHPKNIPQQMAFSSTANEILFGGSAGGGKTSTILGIARTKHTRSLILRRTFPLLERSVISMALEFMGGSYNSAKHVILVGDKRIEFGHMERIGNASMQGDEANYSSAPYDFIGFDQLEEFTEYAYSFMFSRLRSSKPGQKTQIISSANWVGENLDWILKRWRDWIGDNATAGPGEIRWYYRLKGELEERSTPNNAKIWDENAKDWVIPLSRTFIPARLYDNPYLGEEYKAQLQMLPEPLRSALLYGDIKATMTDDAYQVIPRSWVKAAMARWTPERPNAIPVIGVDVARGGDDKTVFAPRYGKWYDQLEKHAGTETPDGQSVVNLMVLLDKDALFNMDVIGIGASAYDTAQTAGMTVTPINFGAGSDQTDKSGMMKFLNKRAECWWKFREALDPNDGNNISLPPDTELEADLCSVRWRSIGGKIQIESKEDVKKRIGRSTDCGDAVVYADAGRALEWHEAGAQKVKGYDNRWS